MAVGKKNALFQFLTPLVDGTDFASVESALTESDINSGITKKFYGYNVGGSAATTSGTISKTVSLVRSGVIRVTLKASETNYDRVMVRLSKTGVAEQIFDFEFVDNDDSDLMSALTVIQSMASDAASGAQQGSSRILLVQSRLSDLDSRLASELSDVLSAANVGNSRVLVVQSMVSDTQSKLSDMESNLLSLLTTTGVTLDASTLSDLRSAIAAGPAATVTASDISDIASAVWAFSTRSVSLLASVMSDLRSAISAGPGATVTASDISDIASAVRAILVSDLSDILSAAQQTNSRVLVVQSMVSDVDSALTSRFSNLESLLTTTGVQINASSLSDVRSAITAGASAAQQGSSRVLVVQSRLSDFDSRLVSELSDVLSQLAVVQSMASDAHSAAAQASSRALVVQSHASDIYSLVSDLHSDVTNLSGVVSDLTSAVSALPTTILDLSNGVETSITLRQALRLILAASAGKLSGAATTTVTIRNVGDTVNRITATVDSDGNRTAVTTDTT